MSAARGSPTLGLCRLSWADRPALLSLGVAASSLGALSWPGRTPRCPLPERLVFSEGSRAGGRRGSWSPPERRWRLSGGTGPRRWSRDREEGTTCGAVSWRAWAALGGPCPVAALCSPLGASGGSPGRGARSRGDGLGPGPLDSALATRWLSRAARLGSPWRGHRGFGLLSGRRWCLGRAERLSGSWWRESGHRGHGRV